MSLAISLKRQQDPLASGQRQLEALAQPSDLPRFEQQIEQLGINALRAERIDLLQMNLGKLCNQTCVHCHVDAGPDRREVMSRQTMEHCLKAIDQADIGTVDLTGGAPEMNPHFRWLVESLHARGRTILNRSNLTILVSPGFEDLPEFLAAHGVEIIASLPCYLEENLEAQRGAGTFGRSIEALQRLNQLGYGQPESDLRLTLVFNPRGATLPPPQEELEAAYRRELHRRYNIVFNRLYTITNMPISRFLAYLLAEGEYEAYMRRLVAAFNPAVASGVMCRTMLSVGWDGRLFDCDFNQMLDLPLEKAVPRHIADFDVAQLSRRRIITNQHCFGCTAGAGSGCQGVIEGKSA